MTAPIGCAVIGYGPKHNFGWAHAAWISATPELRLVAICDQDPGRTEAAAQAFPGIRTYNDVAQVWADDEIQLVSLVTRTSPLSPGRRGLCSRKHVVSRSDVPERGGGDRDGGGRHGRRQDAGRPPQSPSRWQLPPHRGDRGQRTIGEVFHIELAAGGYYEPQNGWYREKATSGGASTSGDRMPWTGC